MKNITCRDIGGLCDELIIASTPDEMVNKATSHMEDNHPEYIHKMSPDEKGKMIEKINMKWSDTVEDM